jgi:vacuolar-type H+-ATPase subunit E/Vma4
MSDEKVPDITPDDAKELSERLDNVKTILDELQQKINSMNPTEIESQETKLQEEQTQTFKQFIEESVRSTGKISEASQVKLKEIYSQTYEDLSQIELANNPKLQELVSKLQGKMLKYFGDGKNIPKNTPLSQFSSIFADGASVLDPNTSTLKKWSDYVKDKVGIETVKTTSPFGELVEEQIRQANTPEMENAHKKMKQQYSTVGEQIQRNIEGASGKTIKELVEEEKNMTTEEVEQRNNEIADKVSEKKGKSVGETIKQYLKYLMIAVALGSIGAFVVNACMCHQAQINSNCVARDPGDPSKKEIINSPNDCEYDCQPKNDSSCVSCCGSCTLFNLVGKDDGTKIARKCCNNSIDKQTDSGTRKGWNYNYECKNGFQQLVDTIVKMLKDAYNAGKDFFNTIWKYVVIIGGAIAAIVIINMISKFSAGGKGKISPVAIGLSAAIVIAIVIWGLVTKWKFISSW